MQIECEFKTIKWHYSPTYFIEKYTCCISGQNLPVDENAKINFKGVHEAKQNDEGITGLTLINCSLQNIPKYFNGKFKNLYSISIQNCGLKKISNADLKIYPELICLNLNHNELELLSENLLGGMSKLSYVHISHNKLKLVEPNIVDLFSANIKYFDISYNSHVSLIYSFTNDNQTDQKQKLKEELKNAYLVSLKAIMNEDIKAKNEKITESEEKVKQLEAKNRELEANAVETAAKTEMLNKTFTNLEPFVNDIEAYLANDNLKDFTLILNDQRFKIHKMILAARSSVFAEMIENNPEAEELKLTDIQVATFEDVLKFVNSDIIPSKCHRYAEMYAVAEKLKIKSLKQAIVKKSFESIDNENVFDLLAFALKHNLDELKEKAMQKVNEIFPGKSLRLDLAEQCEKLKKFADAKRILNETMNDLTNVD
jgi:hypothetical protein